MKTRPHPRSRHGFTLMELLVAMAITAIIVTVLVSITSVSLDAWRRSRAEVRAARQAKAALDTMGRDLESLLVRNGNKYQWLAAKVDPNLTNSDKLAGPTKHMMPNAAQMVFMNAATDRYDGGVGTPKDLGGDVTATCYRLVYRDQIQNKDPGSASSFPAFAIYRHLVNPDETFRTLLAQTDLLGAWQANFEKDDFAIANFLVENIYELTVTFNVEYPDTATGKTLVQRIPVIDLSTSTAATGKPVKSFVISGSGLTLDPANTVVASGRVASIDLAITVLSDFGMQLAERAPNMTTERLVTEHGYHYAKSVIVPQP